jgi:hypothetical protein
LVTPLNLNLQSLLLFDLINEYKSGNIPKEKVETKLSLVKNLEEKCIKNVSGDFNENCRVFYLQAYYLNRWNGRTHDSEMYFNKIINLLKSLKPIPMAFERLQLEQMFLSGKIDINYIKNWIDQKPYLPPPKQRVLFLISKCLLGNPIKEDLLFFYNNNLLIESEFKGYISENVSMGLVDQISSCAK